MADESPQEKEERLQKQEERLQKQHARVQEARSSAGSGGGGGHGGGLSGIAAFIGEHKWWVLGAAVGFGVVAFVLAKSNSGNSGSTSQTGTNASPDYSQAGYQSQGEAYAFDQLTQGLNNLTTLMQQYLSQTAPGTPPGQKPPPPPKPPPKPKPGGGGTGEKPPPHHRHIGMKGGGVNPPPHQRIMPNEHPPHSAPISGPGNRSVPGSVPSAPQQQGRPTPSHSGIGHMAVHNTNVAHQSHVSNPTHPGTSWQSHFPTKQVHGVGGNATMVQTNPWTSSPGFKITPGG